MHPWHDVDPGKAMEPIGFVEIPRGSHNKYELDKPTGLLRLNRVLFSPFVYPFNYGFIPRTLARDGDALDCFVLGESVQAMTLITMRPLGLLRMEDEGKKDDKVLATPIGDPRYEHMGSLDDVAPHHLRELEHFLSRYKDLEGKSTIVMKWESQEAAVREIAASMEAYKREFPKEKPES